MKQPPAPEQATHENDRASKEYWRFAGGAHKASKAGMRTLSRRRSRRGLKAYWREKVR